MTEPKRKVGKRVFIVYHSEAESIQRQRDMAEHQRLSERLIDRIGRLAQMSPESVQKIHAILDEEGLFKS